MKNFTSGAIVGTVIMGIASIIIVIITIPKIKKSYEQKAIKAECAYYDNKTGKFIWKK